MPLRQLGMWIGQAQRATASGERIFQVIDEPEEIADADGAPALPPGPGPRGLRSRHLRLRPGAAGARGCRPGARARAGRRADRPHGRRQDLARGTRPALLRRPGRKRVGRRSRRSRRQPHVAASRDRRDRTGPVPLFGDRAREHRLRPAGRHRGRRQPGGATGSGARVHRGATRRLRDGRRRARDHALRRTAATACDRPRARRRSHAS